VTLGEFFIKLGISGQEKVSKALKTVKGGLQELADTSLETKAAIAGVIYGLERLTGYASTVGMDLQKFAVSTGLSTDALQKWQ